MNTSFIQSLHVRNVKAFQSLTIDRFKQINLIGGKNGSGKTTLLEIIYFLRSSNGFAFFHNHNIPLTGTTLPIAFYNQQAGVGAKIFITAQSSAGILEKNVTVEKYVNKGMLQEGTASLLFQSGNNVPKTIRFVYSADGEITLKGSFDILDGIQQNYIQEPGDAPVLLPTCGWARIYTNEDELGKMITSITLENRKQEFITNLQMMDENIADIMVVPGDKENLIVVQSQKGWLPLSACGGGVIALTNVLLMIMNCKNGFVVADLVDAELHHSVVQEYWRVIALLAQKYNCQLFITTHSVENLRKAYQGIEEAEMLGDMQYIRLDRQDDKSMATPYTAYELHDSLKFNIDVR